MTADTPEPWWANDPELKEFQRQSWEAFQRELDAHEPITPASPSPAAWMDARGCVRELAYVRDHLAQARTRYDEAILTSRAVGLSWGQIGKVLRVSRQYLHRRYGARSLED